MVSPTDDAMDDAMVSSMDDGMVPSMDHGPHLARCYGIIHGFVHGAFHSVACGRCHGMVHEFVDGAVHGAVHAVATEDVMHTRSMETRHGRRHGIVHGRPNGAYIDSSIDTRHRQPHRPIVPNCAPFCMPWGNASPMPFFMDHPTETTARRLGSWLLQCCCIVAYHGACYCFCLGFG